MFVARALKLNLLTQDMIDAYEPALMFTIPRLAIVWLVSSLCLVLLCFKMIIIFSSLALVEWISVYPLLLCATGSCEDHLVNADNLGFMNHKFSGMH